MNARANETVKLWIVGTLFTVFIIVAVIAAGVAGCAGIKSFERSQARAQAHNEVSLTKIKIQNQHEYAEVIKAHNLTVQAEREQRVIQAKGIREAQDEISKTLTPLYIQHEAIEAQKQVATSGQNNTVIYIPSGEAGVPLVSTIGTGAKVGR
jgi:hypothetical protein